MAKYGVCQQVKVEHKKPAGPLQSFFIPEWKWKDITIDFISSLPRGKKGNDAIWVIVNWLTKSTLFLSLKITNSVDKLIKLYVDKMVRLYGIPVSIVFYRDARFTSRL